MLKKSWALCAGKGTKSEWKSCYVPSESLSNFNGEQLQFILTIFLWRQLYNFSFVSSRF